VHKEYNHHLGYIAGCFIIQGMKHNPVMWGIVRIKVNHYKDPYQTTSIIDSKGVVLRGWSVKESFRQIESVIYYDSDRGKSGHHILQPFPLLVSFKDVRQKMDVCKWWFSIGIVTKYPWQRLFVLCFFSDLPLFSCLLQDGSLTVINGNCNPYKRPYK